MQKLLLNGVAYDDVPKALNRVPVSIWIELEEQAGISADALDEGGVGWRTMLACYAFLLRRNGGEAVTWKQVTEETIPDDVIIPDPDDVDSDDEADGEDDEAARPTSASVAP